MEKKENVKIRKVITSVRGKDILFDEYYLVNPITNEEIFDRQLEIENDIRLYDIYKEKTGLLTSNDIKRIRSKYGMNQKEYAFALGFGEITIHRFENGSIQTEAVDSIIRLSDNPDNMHDLLIKNKKITCRISGCGNFAVSYDCFSGVCRGRNRSSIFRHYHQQHCRLAPGT